MSDLQRNGMRLFESVGCTECHSGPAFNGWDPKNAFPEFQDFPRSTDNEFVRRYDLLKDKGRVDVTGDEDDAHLYKVPTLRNITLTAPYFHNGSVGSLSEAVQVMAATELDTELSQNEVKQIVAFLASLEGEFPVIIMPRLPSKAGATIIDDEVLATANNQVKACGSSEAIKRLKQGNACFVAGNSTHPHEKFSWRSSLEDHQDPFAVVLGCSDSRVPPELIFDQGFGDLFVVRVAGNVVDTDVKASVEYATDHLNTKLVVVLGHTHCGAVTAAVDHHSKLANDEPSEIVSLISQIEPVACCDRECTQEQQVEASVFRNVEISVERLKSVPDLQDAIENREVTIVGAIYDIHTGRVRFLDGPSPSHPTKER